MTASDPAPVAPSTALGALQQEIDAWIQAHGGYWPPLANLARLTEEVGELARGINQTAGPKPVKPSEDPADVAGEMADVLWILLCLANQLDVDLEAAFEQTMAKVRRRGEAPKVDPGASG